MEGAVMRNKPQHPNLSFHKMTDGQYGVFWCNEIMCIVEKAYPFNIGRGKPKWQVYGKGPIYPSRDHAAFYGIKAKINNQTKKEGDGS